MFFNFHSETAKPFWRQDGSRRFDFSGLGILFLGQEGFFGRKVKKVQGLSLIVDPHTLELIAVNGFPAHKLIELCREGPAGDLSALSLVSPDHTPADGISGPLFTGADGQLPLFWVDQELNISGIFQLADAGVIEGNTVSTDGHSRVKAVGDHHEPIVSREDYELAGQIIRQHAAEKKLEEQGGKYLSRYPFSGKIVCGQCDSTFKRRTQCSGDQKYILWACREHLEHPKDCSMKALRESVIEDAFTTMMNKLIFAREQILKNLLDAIRRQNHASNLGRINEIEKALDDMRDRKNTLTTIMAKGYLEPAAYNKEMNDLTGAAAAMEKERDALMRQINGDMKKTEALREIIAYTDGAEMLTAFDAELFDRFVDHITVNSKESLVFTLKCGLNLEERVYKK